MNDVQRLCLCSSLCNLRRELTTFSVHWSKVHPVLILMLVDLQTLLRQEEARKIRNEKERNSEDQAYLYIIYTSYANIYIRHFTPSDKFPITTTRYPRFLQLFLYLKPNTRRISRFAYLLFFSDAKNWRLRSGRGKWI